MKWISLPVLLAAAVLSAVSVIPFLPAAKSRPRAADFFIETDLCSQKPGDVQFFYDDGRGIRENLSFRARAPVGSEPQRIRFALPAGRYVAFRFDPIDTDGRVVLGGMRIVDHRGRVVRELPLASLTDGAEVQSATLTAGRLELVIEPGRSDSRFIVAFTPPLRLRLPWTDLLEGWPARAGIVFGVVLALLALARAGSARSRMALLRGREIARVHPRRAILITALGALILSAYPVIFLGRSHVSPSFGTTLLYERAPTLPGGSPRLQQVAGADVGAVMWQHVPVSVMQHDALVQGEFPLWNRYNATGVTLLGQGQSMFGDPLALLVSVANGAAWAWDLKYLAAKWLFAAGLGLTVLTLTGRLSAALLLAASAPFIGFFVYRVNHPAIFSVCYSPWLLWFWLEAARARDWRGALRWGSGVAAASWMLLASGTVKEAYLLLLNLHLAGVLVLLAQAEPWLVRFRKLGALAWWGAVLVMASLPLWLTFFDALGKAYTSYDARSAFQIQPGLLLGLFDEIFYRPLTTGERVFNPSANFFVLLGVLYFLATLQIQARNRSAMALAVAALPAAALAFGIIAPGFVANLPFLGNVAHLDNTFSCVLIVLLVPLAGAGCAAAAERLGTPEGRRDLVVAGLLLLALIGSYLGYAQAAHRSVFEPGSTFSGLSPGQALPLSRFVWGTLIASVGASVLLALAARHALTRRSLGPAGALLLVTAGLVLHWRHGLHDTLFGFKTYTVQPGARADWHAPSSAVETLRRWQNTDGPSRAVGLGDNFIPGWTALYGLETITGPDALANRAYRELLAVAPVERVWDWRTLITEKNLARARRFLDFVNTRGYLAPPDVDLRASGLQLVESADLAVWQSLTAWPRGFFTDRVGRYSDPRHLVKLIAAESAPFAVVRAQDATEIAALSTELDSRRIVPAGNYLLTPNATRFEVAAPGSGVAVLMEAWSPDDFSATLNGNPVPVLRVNHAFKGVFIPAAGRFMVEFRYHPRFWTMSLAIGAAGLALAAATIVVSRRIAASDVR